MNNHNPSDSHQTSAVEQSSFKSKPLFPFKINTCLISVCKPLKLKTNKLPGDFFGQQVKTSRRQRKTPLTDRQSENREKNIENGEDLLPQAQVTSFFKMGDVSSSTNHASPVQNNKFKSEKKLSRKQASKILDQIQNEEIMKNQDISISIDLKNKEEFLGCTFSKKLKLEQPNTPEKNKETLIEKVKSVQMRRKQKLMPPIPTIKRRKSSIGKTKEIKTEREYLSGTKEQQERRIHQELNLPKISRLH